MMIDATVTVARRSSRKIAVAKRFAALLTRGE